LESQSKNMTVFDLACMQNGELSAAVISQFTPNLEFTINNTSYNVHKISKLNKTKDDIITHKQRITIKSSNSNKNIVGYLIYYKNGSSRYYGNSQWEQLSRDIEGIITIDLININNPFHNKSIFYTFADKALQCT
jgi:hypothetical protein